ncbi:MAG: hypothetical protein HY558_06420 [Euryarchaeota archaeon]|nr:hypothetical protein [Euryarchaeota archaeon]
MSSSPLSDLYLRPRTPFCPSNALPSLRLCGMVDQLEGEGCLSFSLGPTAYCLRGENGGYRLTSTGLVALEPRILSPGEARDAARFGALQGRSPRGLSILRSTPMLADLYKQSPHIESPGLRWVRISPVGSDHEATIIGTGRTYLVRRTGLDHLLLRHSGILLLRDMNPRRALVPHPARGEQVARVLRRLRLHGVALLGDTVAVDGPGGRFLVSLRTRQAYRETPAGLRHVCLRPAAPGPGWLREEEGTLELEPGASEVLAKVLHLLRPPSGPRATRAERREQILRIPTDPL